MLKIFVINLKSSIERRKTMERQLHKLGLPFEFFEAVNGAALSEEEIAGYYDMDFYNSRPGYYKRGAMGCMLSHYFLYKKIVEEKIEVALILEDDMVLSKNVSDKLIQLSKNVIDNEAILLFYQSYFPINIARSSAIPVTDHFNLYQLVSLKGIRSTAAYIINLKTAKSMYEGLMPLSTFADDWKTFFDKKLLNGIRIVYPFLLDNTYQNTTINPNEKGGKLVKKSLSFMEKNKIFPIYNLLRWRRMRNTAKSRRCFIVNEPVIDFREN